MALQRLIDIVEARNSLRAASGLPLLSLTTELRKMKQVEAERGGAKVIGLPSR